jgi:hypothetical protein
MQGFVGLIAENAAAFQSQTLLTPAGLSMVPNPTFKPGLAGTFASGRIEGPF